MTTPRHGCKGNKDALPTKPCAHCGRPMNWRKAWASDCDEVKYCSAARWRGEAPAPSARRPAR